MGAFQKIKDIIADELIEELNKLDIFILSSLQLDLDNRRGPICSLEDCLIEYNSDDHSMQTKNIPSKYTFEDYLIKTIEKTCIEKELDIDDVVKSVIHFLINCKYGILKHFNIDACTLFNK